MRSVSTLVVLIALIGVVAVPRTHAQLPPPAPAGPPAGPGAWGEKDRIEPRAEAASAFANGRLYVMGGLARGEDASTLTQEWDPKTDMWRDRAPMPGPLSHPNALTMNGKVYIGGGFLKQVHIGAQDAFFEYDPVKNNWRKLAPLPSPRGSVALVALAGKIHAIGGRNADLVTIANHDVYDPATNTWTPLAPLPQPRDHLAFGAIDGKIYIVGGRTNTRNDSVNRHDIYDPATNAWTSGPALPITRSGGASVVYKGMIVVFGGECVVATERAWPAVEGYDPKTGKWSTFASMPMGKHAMSAATDGDTVYLTGGSPICGNAYTDNLMTFRIP